MRGIQSEAGEGSGSGGSGAIIGDSGVSIDGSISGSVAKTGVLALMGCSAAHAGC